MNNKHYTSVVEVASDESFRAFVRGSDVEASRQWEQWLQENPEQREFIKEARSLVTSLRVNAVVASEATQQTLWQRIQATNVSRTQQSASIAGAAKSARPRIFTLLHLPKTIVNRQRYYWAAAASIAVLICSMIYVLYYKSSPSSVQYATTFGETQTLTLPDGSEVVLNANSELSYQWNPASDREVILKGEAFFKVSKQQFSGNPVKFHVQTADAMVEVLGTEFNVNTRRNRTMVVLNEGKIRLRSSQENVSPIELLPGEASEVRCHAEDGKRTLIKKRVKTELFSSWKDDKFLFEDTPLSEVAQTLKENYDLDIRFHDKGLAQLLFTGNVPTDNVNLLMTAIAESFQLQISRDGTTISINRLQER